MTGTSKKTARQKKPMALAVNAMPVSSLLPPTLRTELGESPLTGQRSAISKIVFGALELICVSPLNSVKIKTVNTRHASIPGAEDNVQINFVAGMWTESPGDSMHCGF